MPEDCIDMFLYFIGRGSISRYKPGFLGSFSSTQLSNTVPIRIESSNTQLRKMIVESVN